MTDLLITIFPPHYSIVYVCFPNTGARRRDVSSTSTLHLSTLPGPARHYQ